MKNKDTEYSEIQQRLENEDNLNLYITLLLLLAMIIPIVIGILVDVV
ncbi:hypothetical protein AsAng_0032600 [Aureispira anguillae]|uniref:Uncharacterized protein n=1 Tax=Aureispira anguillae TaxID=2864201 RepID=A0A916DUB3_9BACT|nr:hypothetical protein AsAng_0032600 [Aureispira anguillae]